MMLLNKLLLFFIILAINLVYASDNSPLIPAITAPIPITEIKDYENYHAAPLVTSLAAFYSKSYSLNKSQKPARSEHTTKEESVGDITESIGAITI